MRGMATMTTLHQDDDCVHQDDDNNNKSTDDVVEEGNSSDDALCEMLGLKSFDIPIESIDDNIDVNDLHHQEQHGIPRLSPLQLEQLFHSHQYAHLAEEYERNSFCFFPSELWIRAATMRRLTDELVWGGEKAQADRTYETIVHHNNNLTTTTTTTTTPRRRTLTRLEQFVSHHPGWQEVANYIGQCLSTLLQTKYVLYKEKLNLKPPGGSGFAPHLDTPSLRMAWSCMMMKQEMMMTTTTTTTNHDNDDDNMNNDSNNMNNDSTDNNQLVGPQTFVTVMVAIDDMRPDNGCLRICKGAWSEDHHAPLIPPDPNGNPDAAGRAGAIPLDVANTMLEYEDVICPGGAIVAFHGWVPHRSAPNTSAFARRAVFFTYNPKEEGDFHDEYYQRMTQLRREWQQQQQQQQTKPLDGSSDLVAMSIDPRVLDALATIPKI